MSWNVRRADRTSQLMLLVSRKDESMNGKTQATQHVYNLG
jgi:hypothetical protein